MILDRPRNGGCRLPPEVLDALVAARGLMDGMPVLIAVQSFEFMGGSLGLATGAGLVSAMQAAVAEKRPFILVVSSGGARSRFGSEMPA